MKEEKGREFKAFIEEWKETPEKNREMFLHFREYLSKKEGVMLNFIPRSGVTYSLRAVHTDQDEKIFLLWLMSLKMIPDGFQSVFTVK